MSDPEDDVVHVDTDRLGTTLTTDPADLAALVDGGAVEPETPVLRTASGRVRVTARGGDVRVERE